jgi:hypothetical protein
MSSTGDVTEEVTGAFGGEVGVGRECGLGVNERPTDKVEKEAAENQEADAEKEPSPIPKTKPRA